MRYKLAGVLLIGLIFSTAILAQEPKEPKGLIPKFSWQGKKEINKELIDLKRVGIPPFWPRCLVVYKNYLYTTEYWDHRIQILKINPDGSLLPKFVFGKRGEKLGEFDGIGDFATKDNYLYIVDTNNHRIQILKINPDGSLLPKFVFGKRGKEAGDFFLPLALAIKGNHLYVSDSGNDRIQVLEIKY